MSQLKIKAVWEKQHDSIHTVRCLWLLSYSAVSRWMTCMCFSVWHSVTQSSHRNVTGPKLNRGRKGKKDELELTEIFSVLFCSWYLLSEFTYSYSNNQNKMWSTVSYLWSMGSLFQKLICRQVSSVAQWIAIYQAFNIYSRRPLVNIHIFCICFKGINLFFVLQMIVSS